MKVIFTFSDESTYESSIIKQGFSCQEILFNRLQASDGSVGFSIPFSTLFTNKMTSNINNNVLAVVYDDDNNPYATGFVKKEIGYEQKYRNQPIKITIVSKSYMLDKTLKESYALESRTSAQIVTWLLTQAGITDIGTLTDMTTIVPLFVFNAGENIKDVLKEFCFEYSKTFYFDKNGYFQVADLFVPSFSASEDFDRTNIRDKVNINVKEAEANCIRGRWTPLELVSNTLVFEDKQGATSQYECVIPIAANSWFGGIEDNFLKCDSTLGEVKYVRTITQNNIQSDTGITKTLDLLERTSLNQLHFTAKNTTASEKNITRMQVYADAYIAKENRVDVTTYGDKEKELNLKYIQDQITAQNFIKALADYYNSTAFTISFSSDVECEIGDLVIVSADGIGSFNCRVIQRTRNIINDTISYVCENIGDYTPAAIVSTVQESLAVNIAGGQKGLDGEPGAPGEDGKNAITMTSATTPSGEYEGQIGFWQGRPYEWKNNAWVCQNGDLPTDAVLHYSFDEVPDYPDGTADVRREYGDTYRNPNEYCYGNATQTLTNVNGNLHCKSTARYGGICLINSIASSKIAIVKVTVIKGTVSIGIINNVKGIGTWIVSRFVDSTFYVISATADETEWELEYVYIGDGSYATPIIDNANGQNNGTNNGGLAVQGLSGKGAYFPSANKYVNIPTSKYPAPTSDEDKTLSLWLKLGDYVDDSPASGKPILSIGAFSGLFGLMRMGKRIYAVIRTDTNNRTIATSTLENNVWYHAVMVYSGQTRTAKLYVNGVFIAETGSVDSGYTFGSGNTVWRVWSNLYVYSNIPNSTQQPATVDDVLIFNRALSEKEVLALYQNNANTPKYYTMSDYNLDAIDDDSVIDHLTEKPQLLSRWLEIYNAKNVSSALPTSSISATGEYKGLIDDASTVGVLSTNGVQAYITASNALRSAFWNTTNGYLVNMDVDSTVRTDINLDSLFATYRQTLQIARTVISEQQASVASALSVVNSNPFQLLPANTGNHVTSYDNTGTRLQVFNGTTELQAIDSGNLSNNEYKVTVSTDGNIIQGSAQTIPSGQKFIEFGNVSNMDDNVSSAVVTYRIDILCNNVPNTIYSTQKFGKSKEGADGRIYTLLPDYTTVKKSVNGTLTPSSITVQAKSWTGSSIPEPYSGGDLVALENNVVIASESQENSITFNPTGDYPVIVQLIRHGTNTLIDTVTIPILQEVKGDQGEAGLTWFSGNAINGYDTNGIVYSGSGISNARIGDFYLNTDTQDIYECVLGGNASTALWKWNGNLTSDENTNLIRFNPFTPITSVANKVYSVIEEADAPWGGTTDVMKCFRTGEVTTQWNSVNKSWSKTPIDTSKKYRFSLFFKQITTASNISNYFGAGIQNNANYVASLGSDTGNTNFYFTSFSTYREKERWYLLVAHIHPFDTSRTTADDDSGIYDAQTGEKLSNVNDCKWMENAPSVYIRNIYVDKTTASSNPDSAVEQWFCSPRVDICNGLQPSVKDLLNGNFHTTEWYSGTAITGTSTEGTVFSNSGIDWAVKGDKYLNTDTNNLYECTYSGSATVAKWAYQMNIKGDTGDDGTLTFVSDQTRSWTDSQWNDYSTAGRVTSWNNSTVEGMRIGDILQIPATLTQQGNITGVVYARITSVPTSKTGNLYAIPCTTLYGQKGNKGESVTIDDTEIKYLQNQDGTTEPADSENWLDNPPAAIAGYFLWTRTKVTYSDDTVVKSYSVTRNGANGSSGANGTSTRYSTASVTSSTTSIALSTITGGTAVVGDVIIAGSMIFTVTAVGSVNATVQYKASIKGEDNKTINVIMSAPNVDVSCDSAGVPFSLSNTQTTIRLYENAQELSYDVNLTTNGTWKATVTRNGCSGGSIDDQGVYANLTAITDLTIDNAYRRLTITGKRTDGSTFETTVTQTFSKNKQGPAGENAKFVEITTPDGLMIVNGSPIYLSLIAVPTGITSPTYKWYKRGTDGFVELTGETSATLRVDSAGVYKVVVNSAYEDYATVTEVNESYACSISNENFSVVTDSSLVVADTTEKIIYLIANHGSTRLTPTTTGSGTPQRGTFRFSVSGDTNKFTITPTSDIQSNLGIIAISPKANAVISNEDITVTFTYDNDSVETKSISISPAVEGVGISNITEYYLRNNSSTAPTFNASTISNWSTSASNPINTAQYLWNAELITKDGGADPIYTTPHLVMKYTADGNPGRGIVTIKNAYKLTTTSTKPEPPSTSASFWSQSTQGTTSAWGTVCPATTPINKYLWNCERIEYSSGTQYELTPVALLSVYGDSGTDSYTPEIKQKLLVVDCLPNGNVQTQTTFSINYAILKNGVPVATSLTEINRTPVSSTLPHTITTGFTLTSKTNATAGNYGTLSFSIAADSTINDESNYEVKLTFSDGTRTLEEVFTVSKKIATASVLIDRDNIAFTLRRNGVANYQEFTVTPSVKIGSSARNYSVSPDVTNATGVTATISSQTNGTVTIKSSSGGAVPSGYVVLTITSDGVSYEKRVTISASKAGKYLGLVNTLPESASVGDFITWGGTEGTYKQTHNYQYIQTNTSAFFWQEYSDDADTMTSFSDIMSLVDNATNQNVKAVELVQRLVAAEAFLHKLFVNKIQLITEGQDIGAIYGGKYDKYGNVNPESTSDKGVYMDANGEFKCVNGLFEGLLKSNDYKAGFIQYGALYVEDRTSVQFDTYEYLSCEEVDEVVGKLSSDFVLIYKAMFIYDTYGNKVATLYYMSGSSQITTNYYSFSSSTNIPSNWTELQWGVNLMDIANAQYLHIKVHNNNEGTDSYYCIETILFSSGYCLTSEGNAFFKQSMLIKGNLLLQGLMTLSGKQIIKNSAWDSSRHRYVGICSDDYDYNTGEGFNFGCDNYHNSYADVKNLAVRTISGWRKNSGETYSRVSLQANNFSVQAIETFATQTLLDRSSVSASSFYNSVKALYDKIASGYLRVDDGTYEYYYSAQSGSEWRTVHFTWLQLTFSNNTITMYTHEITYNTDAIITINSSGISGPNQIRNLKFKYLG